MTAYSPVAKNKFGTNETLAGIARRKDVAVAQVLLSWGVQRGTAVIPKTEREDRMRENITVRKRNVPQLMSCFAKGFCVLADRPL